MFSNSPFRPIACVVLEMQMILHRVLRGFRTQTKGRIRNPTPQQHLAVASHAMWQTRPGFLGILGDFLFLGGQTQGTKCGVNFWRVKTHSKVRSFSSVRLFLFRKMVVLPKRRDIVSPAVQKPEPEPGEILKKKHWEICAVAHGDMNTAQIGVWPPETCCHRAAKPQPLAIGSPPGVQRQPGCAVRTRGPAGCWRALGRGRRRGPSAARRWGAPRGPPGPRRPPRAGRRGGGGSPAGGRPQGGARGSVRPSIGKRWGAKSPSGRANYGLVTRGPQPMGQKKNTDTWGGNKERQGMQSGKKKKATKLNLQFGSLGDPAGQCRMVTLLTILFYYFLIISLCNPFSCSDSDGFFLQE